MSISIVNNGRFGNNLLQYCVAYIFAKKNKRALISPAPTSYTFPPSWETEDKKYFKDFRVTNQNFWEVYNKPTEDVNYVFDGYFQFKEFITEYRQDILDIFDFSTKKENPKDELIVFYRLGDMEGKRQSLPLEYFTHTLNLVNFSSGYIRTDSPTHKNVLFLMEKFGLKLFEGDDPADVIWRAKNFKKMILSEGTFSWWPAFLSQASEIHYNWRRDRFKWHGDIFVDKSWIQYRFDWKDFTSFGEVLSQRSL